MIATNPPTTDRLFNFIGGHNGPWRVERIQAVIGDSLSTPSHLAIQPGLIPFPPAGSSWVLRGITSNDRYVIREEKIELVSKQEGLGRDASVRAALIPIRKTPAWWALTQDERREIFEAQSHHIALGMKFLPAIARRLHHCRDLGGTEPFDFLTWFEYAPADSAGFEELVQALRASPEWEYVEREVDVRLIREEA